MYRSHKILGEPRPRVPASRPDGGEWIPGGGDKHPNTGLNNNQNYSVTESGRREITIRHPNGSLEVRRDGSISWRNNNPGNLRAGSFADAHGAIGEAGGFAVFPDGPTGQGASIALLQSSTYSGLTINQAIARRSPSSENDTLSTQRNVDKIGGFTGNEVIENLSSSRLSDLAHAIQMAEGWYAGTVRTIPGQGL